VFPKGYPFTIGKVRIAFFDLDRTLIAQNSGTLWVLRELQLGRLKPWQALQAAAWLARYELGFAAIDAALRRAIASLAGSQESELRERTASFYDRCVRSLYRPGARQAIEEHRRAGDSLVLLTSSSLYLSEHVARDLNLDGVICNRFEVDENGLHTGRTVGALCFGAGKLQHAGEFAKQNGARLQDCAFYTDSYADLPVLEAVGRPVAVNPDRRLRRVAEQRRWERVDWGKP
jgi:HAD superfamily hydrolase (TIGR01490 family)